MIDISNTLSKIKIAVFGLGYVGLPLAVEFGKNIPTVGFDLNENRINELNNALDHTLEVSESNIKQAIFLKFSSDLSDTLLCNFYIICVPTPVDNNNLPDLSILMTATKMVGEILKCGDIVVFESTVYPGCTEEVCVPILEKSSGLIYNTDFFCGYSPERINPGDKLHRIDNIIKVTSGSNYITAKIVDSIYKIIAKAGTYQAESIKVAEAAKVIENAQRDLNIAFMNELSIIFRLLNIDTEDVLNAAKTKWNFIDFKPGLVGGHCIGVDPFYLTYKSKELGYEPRLLLSGRRLNDSMAEYICKNVFLKFASKDISPFGANVLILGYTFKENCPDIRNTKVEDIVDILLSAGCKVNVYDPIASLSDIKESHEYLFVDQINENSCYDIVIFAVAHDVFKSLSIETLQNFSRNSVIFDLKGILPREYSEFRL